MCRTVHRHLCQKYLNFNSNRKFPIYYCTAQIFIYNLAIWTQSHQEKVNINLNVIWIKLNKSLLILISFSFPLQFLTEKVWYCLHTVGKLHWYTSKLLSVNYVCARSYSMKDKKTSSPISKNILFFKLRVFNLTQLQAVIFYCI